MKPERGELIGILQELWVQTVESDGRRPLRSDLRRYGCPVSGDTFVREFGSWKAALLAAASSVPTDDVQRLVVPAAPPRPVRGAPKEQRKALSLRKRFGIMQRDEFTCQLCGISGPGSRLEVDHRRAAVRGGPDDDGNLWTLCFKCNRGKRTDGVRPSGDP
jgi:hypothetical protein